METDITDAESAEKPRPPWAITLIALLIGIGGGISFSITLLFLASGNTQPHVFVGGALAIMMALCVRGFWLMRRWAVYLFSAMVVISQLGAIAADNFDPLSLVLPGLLLAIAFAYRSRMS